MGDSDEEFDKRRGRDKFRRERNDYERRDRGWEDRGRGEWRGKRERSETYPDYERGRGGGFRNSPPRYGSPPQAKRMREDGEVWQDSHAAANRGPDMDCPTQPPMMSFKQFLQSQDDNITDEEAIRKFNEYKLDFKRQQINEFFLQHKEEEWFRSKYGPEEHDKRKAEARATLQRRCDVFMQLMAMGRVKQTGCDVDKTTSLIKLLDAAVILMENGTEYDLTCLEADYKPSEVSATKAADEKTVKSEGDASSAKSKDMLPQLDGGGDEDEDGEKGETVENGDPGEQQVLTNDDSLGEDRKEEEEEEEEQEQREGEAVKENGAESDRGSLSDDSDDEQNKTGDEPPPPGMEGAEPESYMPAQTKLPSKEALQGEEKEEDTAVMDTGANDPSRPRPLHKTQSIFLRNLAPSITKHEIEATCRRYPGFLRLALQDPAPDRKFYRRGWATFDRTVNIKEICWNLTNIRVKECELGAIVNRELQQRVRPVNGVTSHKSVSKADVKHCAKIVQNFDKKWQLWEDSQEEKKDPSKPTFGLISNNPVLKNITDYLVDEGSYEEEAYLGCPIDEPAKGTNPEVPLERDEQLLRVLDRMILYLRIVHSFDYYSCSEYPNEDMMPNRCGIIHARGLPPTTKITQNDIDDYTAQFERKITFWTELKTSLTSEEAKRLGLKEPEEEVEKFVQANTQELAKDKWLCPLSGKKFKGPDFVRKHLFNKHAEKVEEVRKEVAYFNNYLMDPKRPQLPEHPGNKAPAPAPRHEQSSYAPTGSGQGGYHGSSYQGGGGGGYSQGASERGGYNSFRGGGPSPYGNRGRGRGGPSRGGYHQGSSGYSNRGGYSDYHGSKPDYRRDRSYDRNAQQYQRRDRSRGGPDPRGIVEYRDLDALKEDSDTFFVMDES